MLRLVRSVSLPRLGARRDFVALRQPGFRAYVMRLEGMDYEAVDRGRSKHSAAFAVDLTLVLAGQWADPRGGGVTLRAGEAALGPSSQLADRWTRGVQLVTLEWDEPPVASWSQLELGAKAVRAARVFAETVCAEGAREDDVASLQALVAALGAQGVPVPAVLPLKAPAEAVRAAALLNRALTGLGSAPAWVDFTDERSERQWRRDLKKAAPWVGLLGASFRTTLNTIRLSFAVSLLSVPGATLKEIAAALGYRNDRTLIQALTRAGLPPDEVRRRVTPS